ncbi:DEAD-domain-containing protein [Hypoxylon fragiforme]|uniref:DEAD-domain-containing protein n=1 Tax=Hypoxylon fragiforme TaxID=63214 RepID=UPI0020C6CDE3|nr:DEAD-domain-containing protein [Hypoxylon fragiforme]KAI2603318.1 DEAD-domain-containing protein [Hypoxylon fragiforme]
MENSQTTPSRPRRSRGRGNKYQKSTFHSHGPSQMQTSLGGPAQANDMVPSASVIPNNQPKFKDLGNENLVHPSLLLTLAEDLKYEYMTPVQAATIYPLLKENCDILAQAKTGTGKTVAFLVPAIQRMLTKKLILGREVSLLVISPTRELAMQIATEARALVQRFKECKVCIAIGGTNKSTEEKRIAQGCDILIATPGRLIDHLEGEDSDGRVKEKLRKLDTLVLDEADRLLDMGFLSSLKRIIQCLPDKASRERQSMLFSATVPSHVQKVSQLVLAQNYKSISTIPVGEPGTHERVVQHLVTVPTFSQVASALVGIVRQEGAHAPPGTFKAIIFAPTARLVDFYLQILSKTPGLPTVMALHSRMSQSKRGSITEQFRKSQSSILIATDVIARGMDFPSVTNVIQVGIPSDKESYIHRLGRTARAGAEGRGTFLVTQHESYFATHTLKDVKFVETPADLSAHQDVLRAATNLDPAIQASAYQGWLGYYKSYVKNLRWDSQRLVNEANELALNGFGAAEVPGLQKSTVSKMGLKGVQGLRIVKPPPRDEEGAGNMNRQKSKRPINLVD